ncbi:putative ENT domain, Agenet-like domain, Agenet domain, plant type, ENT domain-like superfamily [Helianthus annuus]|uniref:ENT domain, Agenet-like domain, Agenet domain, plant type, ENT domain-like superfamily n=1 Tax=Helianthus annuus TaxID=4232 RepID=A0A9K3JE18_HELAN|nr:putative ENT domain, Agenet-like domain, Agenet domain, plant type, ENT domain-like superfamily [Helianthus annuus]KAJ0495873.1 putative ENT domain, Agenet-like domain, Agenet domain, plant type, ENT domain-like superfamily [Helianthus annuus]KAJ0591620.1 putative ENT domain, Agenet-like domain, Agenet domain, plant type, ENT domain-like superfamily [Helianthus annuus]KAJ0606514.1 putative ENT domain, Agenet-like domain, Agenet domain, plant type, ENT domain-like superfamily [Helianthus annuu
MKYKRGSTVEVFCDQSWRCARIVSSKGHNYTVSYDVYPGFTSKDDVEHISVKSIRPCPPLLESSECWAPGDVAEVFHNLSWKMAIVLTDIGLDQFIVRLVGSLREFEVTKSELRVRKSYQNGQWIVTGKVPSDHKEANGSELLKYGTQDNHRLMASRIVFSKTQKRASPGCDSQDEMKKKRARKLTMCGKEGRHALVQGTSPEKVDDVESSSDIEDHESDAESVCQCGYHEESQSQGTDESGDNKAVADEIHSLELHAYRYTMVSLHASGPLNWEKETMVTNLRISLHISNDEHLIMLKNLISASNKQSY